MVNIKKVETILIRGTTKKEVQVEINKYIELGFKSYEDIHFIEDERHKYLYYSYVKKDEFQKS